MITLLVVIVLAGLIAYLVNTFIPMAPPFKNAFNVILGVVVCVYAIVVLLSLLGIMDVPGVYGAHRAHLR